MWRSVYLLLKVRVMKSSRSLSVPLISVFNRDEKYKQWNDTHMEKAVDAVRNQGLTVCWAAEKYCIPKSTLHNRLSERVQIGACSGPPKYLTDEEENELLMGCASVGYARSHQQVIQLMQEVVNRKGLPAHVTHGWWDSFKRRHSKLTLHTAAPVSYARLVAVYQQWVRMYHP